MPKPFAIVGTANGFFQESSDRRRSSCITHGEFLYSHDGCNAETACAFPVILAGPLPECNHLSCSAIVLKLTAAPDCRADVAFEGGSGVGLKRGRIMGSSNIVTMNLIL